MKYVGGCHCGKVKFEVEMEVKSALSCNCSICTKRGSLLGFAPQENFHLISGRDHLSEYLFNTHTIHHLFCKTCGILSYGTSTRPDGQKMTFINLRCLEGVDVEKLEIQKFDGRSR